MHTVIIPLLILMLASLGCGTAVMRPFGGLAGRCPGLRLALAYTLGQGTIATLLMFLALAGRFTFFWLLALLLPPALYGLRQTIRAVPAVSGRSARQGRRLWRKMPLLWKLLALAIAAAAALGATTFAQPLLGDAVA